MMYICNNLGDLHGLLKLTRTSEDKTTLLELSISLIHNTRTTLLMENTHELKGSKNKLFQIIVDDMRIIYFKHKNNIFIVNFCYKQKGKTEKHYIDTADKRATTWKNILNIK